MFYVDCLFGESPTSHLFLESARASALGLSNPSKIIKCFVMNVYPFCIQLIAPEST